MISRPLWFLAGAGAGVYAAVRARRVAEDLTPEGLKDRASALGVGARLFAEEVRAGKADKESELRQRLGLVPHGTPELEGGNVTRIDQRADEIGQREEERGT